MSRLYDRIMANHGKDEPKLLSVLKQKTVVVADNVAGYFFENEETIPQWNAGLPHLPIKDMFIEMHNITSASGLPNAWAICPTIYNDEWADWWSKIMHASVILEWDEYKPSELEFGLHYFANADDTMFRADVIPIHPRHTFFDSQKGYWDLYPESRRLATRLANACFFAIALMNCKNVELIDQYPLSALSRRHERKYHTPLVKYKVIKVNPMRTVKHVTDLTAEQPEPQSHLDLPLSIWRGHFKDYRDGKGLFGNPSMRGVYWWDQHVRGSIENGVNIKDYEVEAPRESDSNA